MYDIMQLVNVVARRRKHAFLHTTADQSTFAQTNATNAPIGRCSIMVLDVRRMRSISVRIWNMHLIWWDSLWVAHSYWRMFYFLLWTTNVTLRSFKDACMSASACVCSWAMKNGLCIMFGAVCIDCIWKCNWILFVCKRRRSRVLYYANVVNPLRTCF